MRTQSNIALVAALISSLGACASGGSRPDAVLQDRATRVALSAVQDKAVVEGVGQMVERPDGMTIDFVTAIRNPQRPGLQVCGYVSSKDASGKQGADLPFYIELLDKGGKPVAERGQVGSDPSRLSKVKFMCRNNL